MRHLYSTGSLNLYHYLRRFLVTFGLSQLTVCDISLSYMLLCRMRHLYATYVLSQIKSKFLRHHVECDVCLHYKFSFGHVSQSVTCRKKVDLICDIKNVARFVTILETLSGVL